MEKSNALKVIDKLIDERGCSLEEVAARVGVSAATVWRWRRRRNAPRTRAVIEKILSLEEEE